jgi:hypothetical protein
MIASGFRSTSRRAIKGNTIPRQIDDTEIETDRQTNQNCFGILIASCQGDRSP